MSRKLLWRSTCDADLFDQVASHAEVRAGREAARGNDSHASDARSRHDVTTHWCDIVNIAKSARPAQHTAAHAIRIAHCPKPEQQIPRKPRQVFVLIGGRYWDRTSGPCRVKASVDCCGPVSWAIEYSWSFLWVTCAGGAWWGNGAHTAAITSCQPAGWTPLRSAWRQEVNSAYVFENPLALKAPRRSGSRLYPQSVALGGAMTPCL